MILTFEYTLEAGSGSSPQVIHDSSNRLRVIYLDENETVHCTQAEPELGLYDDLGFTDIDRVSPDDAVSYPSLKKVAHYGAYGFWSSDGDHRFVIYMTPADISDSLLDGQTQMGSDNEISSMSCSLINRRGKLINRYRSIISPGTCLELYFSLGSADEIPMGVFYIDRAAISYPEQNITVTARDAVGKLLKEQTFDDNILWQEGSLHDNIEAILRYAGVEDFFAGDPGTDEALVFEPNTNLLEGLQYAISLLDGWKIGQTLTGAVGVAPASDTRFEQPTIYNFERDRSCWSYSVDYDDSNGAANVCVYSNSPETDGPVQRVTVKVGYNRYWTMPEHRTLYVQTVDGATKAQVQTVAEALAASVAASGKTETFAGLFTPQLVLGDEVRINVNGAVEMIGTVTDITHSFGRSGFLTSFTVDSGGRRGRSKLKDLINTASRTVSLFTGVKAGEDDVYLVDEDRVYLVDEYDIKILDGEES